MLLTHIARFKYMMNQQFKNHRLEYFFLVLVCIIPQKFGSILIAIAYLNHNHTNIIRKTLKKNQNQLPINRRMDPNFTQQQPPSASAFTGTLRRPLPLPPIFKGGGRLSAGAVLRITCFRWF